MRASGSRVHYSIQSGPPWTIVITQTLLNAIIVWIEAWLFPCIPLLLETPVGGSSEELVEFVVVYFDEFGLDQTCSFWRYLKKLLHSPHLQWQCLGGYSLDQYMSKY